MGQATDNQANSDPPDDDDYFKITGAESLTVPDIRNKLSPIKNLVLLIEKNIDRELILKQLPQVKKSINYLAQQE